MSAAFSVALGQIQLPAWEAGSDPDYARQVRGKEALHRADNVAARQRILGFLKRAGGDVEIEELSRSCNTTPQRTSQLLRKQIISKEVVRRRVNKRGEMFVYFRWEG